MPYYSSEPLFGSDKAGSDSNLYRCRRLLADTRHSSRRTTLSQETNDFETAQPCSIEPNDEILACGLHDFFGDDRQLIGDQHPFDLLHQAVN